VSLATRAARALAARALAARALAARALAARALAARALAACALVTCGLAAGGCGTPKTATQTATASTGETTSTGGAGGTGGTVSGAGGSGADSGGPVDFCKDCALKSGCSSFASGDLLEISGVAPSHLHDGAYYVHNDSGDSPRYFATNCAGDDLGIYKLVGATAADWEDMAAGPCDGKKCLFFGDIGDNLEARTDYVVYRTPEPAALGPGVHQVGAEKFPFAYPDGSHDAETILVHPLTGELTIVTKLKKEGKSGVYTFPTPLTPDVQVTLVKTGELAVPTGSVRFTGGAVHPKAEGILLRTYTSLFFYPLATGQTLGAALAGPGCEMPVMLELQGESVTFTPNGKGYLTVSEQSGQSLHFATCQ